MMYVCMYVCMYNYVHGCVCNCVCITAMQDCTLKRNELGAIRTQLEREFQEKKNLEDSVMEKMMQQLTMDKASQYTQRAIGSAKNQTNELVRQLHA